jgi:hypothetical protein
VQRGRQGQTHWLTVYAKVPEDLRDIITPGVRFVPAMNQSPQYFEVEPNGVELDIEK